LLAYPPAVLLIGGLLAWPVYALAHLAGLDPSFHKLVFRLLELLAIVGLWPVLRLLGRGDRDGWGFRAPHPPVRGGFARGVLNGLALGIASFAAVALVLVLLEVRVVRVPIGELPGILVLAAVKACVAGLVIAGVEELWFRGGLHTALESVGGVRVAVAVTALIYAAVHFVRPDAPVIAGAVDWTSGFTVIGHSFDRFARGGILADFCALAAAGILLGRLRSRSSRIAECIGVHAGWIVVIRSLKSSTHPDPDASWGWLAGGFDGVIGWLACAVLLAFAAGLELVSARRPRPVTQ
jgi:membrane protease YdiL (CAAX protease family)